MSGISGDQESSDPQAKSEESLTDVKDAVGLPDSLPPSKMSLSRRLVFLLGIELVFGLVVLVVVVLAQVNVAMAMLAWFVCLVGTCGAHVAAEYPKGDVYVLARLAIGMACRTLFPLAFAIWGLKFCKPRIESSVVLVLVFAYLVGLIADSCLSLQRFGPMENKQV